MGTRGYHSKLSNKYGRAGIVGSSVLLILLVVSVSLGGATRISHAAEHAMAASSVQSNTIVQGDTVAIAAGQVATATSTSVPAMKTGPALPAGVYHFVGSLVASPGAQVSHVEGILTLKVDSNGALSGSTLRLTSGNTINVSGAGNNGQLSFDINSAHYSGLSSAVSNNRLTGLFTDTKDQTIGFWVATRVTQDQMGTHFTFTGKLASGPDNGMSYHGTLELWGDTYGGLLGWLTLGNGTVLNVSGQSVNGNVNMLIIVRTGTPMIDSGTRDGSGNLHGTIEGPLAGDEGTWTATK